MDPRQSLLKRIGDINNFDIPRPLVTLEEFFEGNEDSRSLRWGVRPSPSPQELYAFLQSLRDRQEIINVLMEIAELETPDAWPCSDAIWILTRLSLGGLKRLVPDRYHPDQWRNYPPGHAVELINIPEGAMAIAMVYK